MNYYKMRETIKKDGIIKSMIHLEEYIVGNGYFVMVLYWTDSGKLIEKSWSFKCNEFLKAQAFYYKACLEAWKGIYHVC